MLKKIEQKLNKIFFTKNKQRAFLEDVCTLVNDGVPAPQAIKVIQKVSSGITQEVAINILHLLAQGKCIADGMEGWFPQPVVEIIRNGEDGGSLANAMRISAKTLAQHISAANAFFASLTYPVVVLFMGCGIAVFLRNFIFSSFASIKPIMLWPEQGRLFMQFSGLIQYWWWAIILIIIFLIVIFAQLFLNFVGESRKFLDKFFPFNIYRLIVAARFMEILGLLISSGLSFKEALNIIQHKATRYLAWNIYMMQFRLSGGRENLADVLDTGLIAAADIERLKAIAQSKNFEHALIQLGNQSAQRNMHKMKRIFKTAGAVLLCIDAGLAIFMIFAVYGVGMFIGAQA